MPLIIYSQFGSQIKESLPISDWIDANSVVTLLNPIIQVSDKERWITYNATDFLIKSSLIFNIVYTHQFYIEIETEPPEGGNVNPASNWYDFGSEIVIRATPNEGWKFMYWEGIIQVPKTLSR